MKNYTINHLTQYEFNKAVYLEPHVIRLMPRLARGQKLVSFDLRIDPDPETIFLNTDLYGNLAYYCSFTCETPFLQIETSVEIEFDPADNPYAFIVYPFNCSTLPLIYPVQIRNELDTCVKSDFRSLQVDDLARKLAEAAGMNTVVFLGMLARCLYDTINHTIREDGPPMHPEQTLREQKGSCRDLAVLYMEACRCMGIATRFVSGYVCREHEEDTAHHLHAWVEAYLPSAGWVGFDPSLGLACNASYVALAAARNPVDAAPVTGTYRGDYAESCLSYSVSIQESVPLAT